MKKSLMLLLSLILAFSVILTACGGKEDQGADSTPVTNEPTNTGTEISKPADSVPQILRLNNASEPGALHPGLARGTHDSWILEHTFEGLTKKGIDGSVEPGMAESWELTPEGDGYIFHLRDSKWSNGDPVLATDFEYAWKHALDPATGSEYAYQLYYVKNGEAYNSGKASRDDVGVKAIDEKTLEVILENPVPYFLDLVNHYTYYPIHQKVAENNPNWYKEAATHVSNGAFSLTTWNHKENVILTKNENYYNNSAIKLSQVELAMIEDENTEWQMYQAGDLDVTHRMPQDLIPTLVNDPEFVGGRDLASNFYRFNVKAKPFNNVKVRKALAMAINRQEIVDYVLQDGALPAFSNTPSGIPDVNGDFSTNTGKLFNEDVALAQQLLKEGLAEEGMDKLSFSLIYNTSNRNKAVAEAIQQMWKKNLGLEVALENMDFQIKIDRESNYDFEVSRAGWLGDYVDPMTFIDQFVTDGGNNNTGWGNAEYDRLVAEAKSTMDQNVRMSNMHKAEQILAEEMPVMPIFFNAKPYMVKSNVKGIYKPINRYPQFHYAYIEK